MSIAQIGGALALIGTLSGGIYFMEDRFATAEEVASNRQAILMIRIQNAKQRGDMALFRNLCHDFRRLYGWTPKICS